jgi:hypothetical protein
MLMTGSITTELPVTGDAESPVFADLVQASRIELYACTQLLAERARFVTGATWVAIAIREGEQFVYCASVGSSGPEIGIPEIGTEADIDQLRDWVQQSRTVFRSGNLLLVPIVRDSKMAGFFQLASESGGLKDQDPQPVARLADMVNTALDHMEAAERSGREISSGADESSKPEIPVLWHAPNSDSDSAASEHHEQRVLQSQDPSTHSVAAAVHACGSCGFPVSRERTVCVDCEERIGTTNPVIPKDLFVCEKQESWMSAHGYTIASLLVSALVAALIYWLR